MTDPKTAVPTDWLGRPLAGSRDRATHEPGGCECNRCGAIFVGAEWHDLCGMCWAEPAPNGVSK